MYKGKGNQIYPAVLSPCPDYYSLDTLGKCNANPNIWKIPDNSMSKVKSKLSSSFLACNSVDFSGNSLPGTGPSSGLCNMKTWANECGVTWDGITNNSSICYN